MRDFRGGGEGDEGKKLWAAPKRPVLNRVKRSLKVPFVILVDFRSILKTGTDSKSDCPNIRKHQHNIAGSYGYNSISVDEKYSRPYKSYFGEDAIEKFISDVISEREYYRRLLARNFNETPVMTEKIY